MRRRIQSAQKRPSKSKLATLAEAERIKATVACIEQSSASKEGDYKLAGHKAAKCAEQIR